MRELSRLAGEVNSIAAEGPKRSTVAESDLGTEGTDTLWVGEHSPIEPPKCDGAC